MATSTQPSESLYRGDRTGEAVYTTLLWLGGPPPTWPLHMARLRQDAAQIGLPPLQLDGLAHNVALACQGKPMRVRIDLVADGGDPLQERPWQTALRVGTQSFDIQQQLLKPVRLLPVAVGLCQTAPTAGAKLAAMPDRLLARARAQALGYDDAALLCADGHVAECAFASLLFGLKDGSFGMASPGCGQVRSTTIAAIRATRPLREVSLVVADMDSVRWALQVNAVIGARAVAAIADKEFAAPPRDLAVEIQRLTRFCGEVP